MNLVSVWDSLASSATDLGKGFLAALWNFPATATGTETVLGVSLSAEDVAQMLREMVRWSVWDPLVEVSQFITYSVDSTKVFIWERFKQEGYAAVEMGKLIMLSMSDSVWSLVEEATQSPGTGLAIVMQPGYPTHTSKDILLSIVSPLSHAADALIVVMEMVWAELAQVEGQNGKELAWNLFLVVANSAIEAGKLILWSAWDAVTELIQMLDE